MKRAAVSMEACSQGSKTYFKRAKLFWMVLITASIGYYGWVVFSPSTVPYNYLGPLGTFTKYLVENHKSTLNIGYLAAWLIHLVEAMCALKLCKVKGITDVPTQIQWFVQTFLFGLSSLFHLLVYKPQKKHQ